MYIYTRMVIVGIIIGVIICIANIICNIIFYRRSKKLLVINNVEELMYHLKLTDKQMKFILSIKENSRDGAIWDIRYRENIAKDCGISVRSVYTYINKFKELDYIVEHETTYDLKVTESFVTLIKSLQS